MSLELPINYDRAEWHERRNAREEYVRQQDGKCWYCKSELNRYPPRSITDRVINWKLFPKNFLKHPVHLHHSHKTSMTIGAVHAYCNAVLWQYEGE